MNDLLLKVYFKGKTAIHNFLHNEKGASEVIATVIILGIVVILGFMFKDKIGKLWDALWLWIEGANENSTGPDLKGKL